MKSELDDTAIRLATLFARTLTSCCPRISTPEMMKFLRLQAKVEAKEKVQDVLVQLMVLLGEGVALQGGIIPGGKLG